MDNVLGLIGIVVFLRFRDRARGGVTWLVVKLSPGQVGEAPGAAEPTPEA